MKKTFEIKGTLEFDRADLTKILYDWIRREENCTPKTIQWPKDFKKMVVLVDDKVDQGAKPFGAPQKEPKKTTKYKGKSHKWEAIYRSIGEILDEQRKRKRSFISYSDLLAEMHEMTDSNGKPLFVKPDGEKFPMDILRHRLAPSQVKRQAKTQPNLVGVEQDKSKKGVKFS